MCQSEDIAVRGLLINQLAASEIYTFKKANGYAHTVLISKFQTCEV